MGDMLKQFCASLSIKVFVIILFCFLSRISPAIAQINFNFPLNTSSAPPQLVLGGSATLTANNTTVFTGGGAHTITDPNGQGWLSFTPNVFFDQGYVVFDQAFSPPTGLVADFEYKIWKPLASASGKSFGLSVFLFDPTLNPAPFTVNSAGSGYTCYNVSGSGVNGLPGGYLGIGVDPRGSYSQPNCRDACASTGNISNQANFVVLRGASPCTPYITGSPYGEEIQYPFQQDARPDDNIYYRRMRFYFIVRGGGIYVTVTSQTKPNAPFVKLIDNQLVNQTITPGQQLKIGVFGSSNGVNTSEGNASSRNEIRNLTVSTPMDLRVSNIVNLTTAQVGNTVNYTTVIRNDIGNPNAVTSIPARFSINPTGVTIPSDITPGVVYSTGGINIVRNGVDASGNPAYDITNFPIGASLTLTYTGVIASTAASAINNAQVVPPAGYGNIDPNDGRGVAQTFIQPVMAQPQSVSVCPNTSLNVGFAATPTAFTQYTWNSTVGPSNASTQPSTIINDQFSNSTGSDINLNYTITPQISAVVVNSDGSSDSNITHVTYGTPRTFTATIKGAPGAGGAVAINVNPFNDGTNVTFTPSSSIANPTYTWYRDAGSPRVVIAHDNLVISASSLVVGSNYNYYVSVIGTNACESNLVSGSVLIPAGIQSVTLTFTDSSGNSIPTINGSSVAYMKASLPTGVTAPSGGVTINLSSVPGSTAVNGVNFNYSSTPVRVTIPAGQNSVVSPIIMAQNTGVIGGTTSLSLGGTPPSSNFIIASTPTITLRDSSGDNANNRVVTIGSGSVTESRATNLTVSLPVGVTVTQPVSVTITPTPSFPSGYQLRIGSQIISPGSSFTVVIPAGQSSASYGITTTLNSNWPNNSIFSLNASAITNVPGLGAFSTVAGTLTVTSFSSDRVFKIMPSLQSTVEGGAVTFTAVRLSAGSSVNLNLTINSSGLASPIFSASIPSTISFGTAEFSKVFAVSTSDLNHSAPAYELFTVSGQEASGSARVNSATLTVVSRNIPTDRRFVITPLAQSVIEGGGVSFTITRSSAGSVVNLNLNALSAGVGGNPNFSASLPSSVSFGATDLSKVFRVSTNNGNHIASVYELFTINAVDVAGPGASQVSAAVLKVNSSNLSADHRFVITPSMQSVIEGGSVTFSITRISAGSVVNLNLSAFNSGLSSPAFQVTLPSSINFSSTEVSKVFVVNTVNGNHAASAYELITISAEDVSGAAASQINSASLKVNSINLSADRRFIITPSPQSVIEGGSVSFTITRLSSGSAVSLNLGVSSAGLTSPAFVVSFPSSIVFGSTDVSKVFVVSTTNGNHLASAYELFTISADDISGPASSQVNSAVLKVNSSNLSADHRFVITPSPQSVIEGGSVTFTVTRLGAGSAVSLNLSTSSAGVGGSPAFPISLPSNISFGSTEITKVFVVNTTNLNHVASVYELFTISAEDAAGPAASQIRSAMLKVNSNALSADRRFVITPSPESVVEGGSVTFSIARVSVGSAVSLTLSVSSAGVGGSTAFVASLPSSVNFSSTEFSKVFVVNTSNMNHTASQFELFTISAEEASGPSAVQVRSALLKVNGSSLSADHRFVITPSAQSVIEGGSITFSVTRQSAGSAVTLNLSGISAGLPVTPAFQISLTSSISFGNTELSKVFAVSTTNGNHAATDFQLFTISAEDVSGPGASQVRSAVLKVNSNNVPLNRRFVITPSPESVIEGGNVTFNITRLSVGAAVSLNLSIAPAALSASTSFVANLPSSIIFSSTEFSKSFVVSTTNLNHLTSEFELFTVSADDTGGPYASQVNAAVLKVNGGNLSTDRRFVITPSSQSVIEGGSVTFSITRLTAGSAVSLNLNRMSAGVPANPAFQISLPNSISFGSTELSKVFAISTTNGNHAATDFQLFTISAEDASGPAASQVRSAVLRVNSNNLSADHRFVITPSPQSVIEGSSVTFTITRLGAGSTVNLNLNITSAGLNANTPFAVNIPGSINFSSTEFSKSFVVNTTSLNHTASEFELFSINAEDGAGPAASQVNAAVLKVNGANLATDRRFVITPSSQSLIEGGSITYSITRLSAGSAVSLTLSAVSAGLPASPDFQISLPSSVSFSSTEFSKIFTVNTTNGNHADTEYQLFSISAEDISGPGASQVRSAVLRVNSNNLTADRRFVITPSPQSVIEGGSVTFTITRLSAGSVVALSLSAASAGLTSPAFQINLPNSINFDTTELSKAFVVNTINGNHLASVFELFTINAEDISSPAASQIRSAVLRVNSSNLTADRRFVITPSLQSVIEGGSVTFSITRISAGSAVNLNLSALSANLGGNPAFQASLPSSIIFGNTELSKIFVVNTTNLNHPTSVYELFTISAEDASSPVASEIRSASLRVNSSNLAADHRFVITPSPQSIVEGGSISFSITRLASGSVVTLSLNAASSDFVNPDFQISLPASVTFGSNELSKVFVVNTINGSHLASMFELFTINAEDASSPAASQVRSAVLKVNGSNLSADRRFVITPSLQSITEGDKVDFTISRISAGSPVSLTLSASSAGLVNSPAFMVSLPSTINFNANEFSKVFTVNTTNLNHAVSLYELFTIHAEDSSTPAASQVRSAVLRVNSGLLNATNRFVITPSPQSIVEGGSVSFTITRLSAGTAVNLNLNVSSAELGGSPAFPISLPTSVNFSSTEFSKVFVVNTTNLNHAASLYELFTISAEDNASPSASQVRSATLKVNASALPINRRFVITPSSQSVIEGGSVSFSITRLSAGSAVSLTLNASSAGLGGNPAFIASLPSIISFATTELSKNFIVSTSNLNHDVSLYELFTISAEDISGPAVSQVRSAVLKVNSSALSGTNRFVITPSVQSVVEGGSVGFTITRETAGPAINLTLSASAAGLASPAFQISLPSSISFAAGEQRKSFVLSTTNQNHLSPAYDLFTISAEQAPGSENVSVNSSLLTILSNNISSNRRFAITPSPNSVVEGGSVTFSVTRPSTGIALTLSFSIMGSGLVNPSFAASLATNTLNFAVDEFSKDIVINTTNLAHNAPDFEIFTIYGQDAAGPGYTQVSSGLLNVYAQNVAQTNRFTISPATLGVIEGKSATYTITRSDANSTLDVNLSLTSANLVSPSFVASLPDGATIHFSNGELIKTFIVSTANLNHIAAPYEIFTISGVDALSIGATAVSSATLNVYPFNGVTMTASNGVTTGTNIGVVQGQGVTIRLNSARPITANDGNLVFNMLSAANSTNPTVLNSPLTIVVGTSQATLLQTLNLSNNIGEDELLVVNAIDTRGTYLVNPVTITVQAYPIPSISGPLAACFGQTLSLTSAISNYNVTKYAYTFYNPSGGVMSSPVPVASGVYQVSVRNLASSLVSVSRASITVTIYSQIMVGVTPATICGGNVVDLRNQVVNILPGIDPVTYNLAFQDPSGAPMGSTIVSSPGTYRVMATNPNTGCSSSWVPIVISSGNVASFTVNSPVTIYNPFLMDLTDPSVIASADPGIAYYNYFDTSGLTMSTASASNVNSPGIYYLQAVSSNGSCPSALVPIQVFFGPMPTLQLTPSAPTIKEGTNGSFLLSLLPGNVTIQKPLSFTISLATENRANSAHYTLPIQIVLPARQNSVSIPISAIKDNILFNEELLAIRVSNGILGSVTASITITDETSLDPDKLAISIGDGTIYDDTPATIRVSLPKSVTATISLTIALKTGRNSNLTSLPEAPVYPVYVTIPGGSNFVNFEVSSAGNDSDVEAILIIEGSVSSTNSELAQIPVKSGKITISNKKISPGPVVSDNGDGINDTWSIGNIERYPDNEVNIVNRVGELVWSVNGYDGKDVFFAGSTNNTRKSHDLPDGIYYYRIRIVDKGLPYIFKGYVKVKR